ncbi:rhamnosidase A [Oceanicola granulosus HTCC2516]|uniref:alpha-L-rhamnosidase n=1 Tax=Oceanicola granulosus (strain ATCC BAA-861 / DSM 15982 / KCTC 12143 / HTCC2516) TaxID=314256 RepID=Q2CH52_OCEGH|nr:alpha-L-rhamnosidase [Oceanicola granulosus]EAR51959.1 rhamnosidase A [Oceanicola granulosus HTCC2516]
MDQAVDPRDAHAPLTRTWNARAISPADDPGHNGRAHRVVREFTLDEVTGREQLHVTALGIYTIFLNGHRLGPDLLAPGWTNYDARLAYQTYDLDAALAPGSNRLEIWLGDGWYRGQLMWPQSMLHDTYGTRVAALAELTLDGDTLLATGPDWTSGPTPVLRNGIYYGETFDAREVDVPAEAGVEVVALDTAILVAQECPPVQELAPLSPVRSWGEARATSYDFGQNIGGYVAFTVTGDPGARLVIEHAEVCGQDGEIDNSNYRSAPARIEYTLAGNGPESYRPHFTFMGFRYARVTIEGDATLERIEAVPISSVTHPKGAFTCGVPAIDRLVLNTLWSQRGNFIDVPTDCPQRDERLGWTGDAQVFAATACWLHDCQAFFRKYLRELIVDQRPDGAISNFSPDPTRLHPDSFGIPPGSTGWGDVITVLPWTLWLHYGDKAALAEAFPAMQRWMDYLWSLSDGPIILPPPGTVDSGGRADPGFTFGDWLQPVGDNRKPQPTIGDDCAATLYHYISADLVARTAEVLGERDAATRFRARAEEIKAAFAEEFITPSGRIGASDQTTYALAFLHGLVPEQHVPAATRYFRRAVEATGGKIGTGFIGTPAILPALTRIGARDLAAMLLLNRDAPGWLYQVDLGATTIWERWDAMGPNGEIYDPEMNSYNHYAYGAICQWLFESVAGIAPDPDAPAFARVRVDPFVLPELSPVSARHETAHGEIAVDWTCADGRVAYTLTLPEGTEGHLPASPDRSELTLNGTAATAPLTLPPGRHEIAFRIAPAA